MSLPLTATVETEGSAPLNVSAGGGLARSRAGSPLALSRCDKLGDGGGMVGGGGMTCPLISVTTGARSVVEEGGGVIVAGDADRDPGTKGDTGMAGRDFNLDLVDSDVWSELSSEWVASVPLLDERVNSIADGG